MVVGQELDRLGAGVGVAVLFHDLGEQDIIAVLLGLLEHFGGLGAVGQLVEIQAGGRQRAEEAIRFLFDADPGQHVLALGVLARQADENVLVDFQQFLQMRDGDVPLFVADVIVGGLDGVLTPLFVLGQADAAVEEAVGIHALLRRGRREGAAGMTAVLTWARP